MIIATTYINMKAGWFEAKLLHEGSVDPVQFFKHTHDLDEMNAWLVVSHPFVEIVTADEFQLIINKRVLSNQLSAINPEAMTDEQIMEILDEADKELDRMEAELEVIYDPLIKDDI